MSALQELQGLQPKVVPAGTLVKLEQLLGEGGQGTVYRVDVDGEKLALKWYHRNSATDEQRRIIEQLVTRGSPAPGYLWPIALVEASKGSGFGYLMPLREARFHPCEDLMARRVSSTFHALMTAGYQLTDSFFQLHVKGLCYRDISFGNIFFDPKSGDIQICDNDNVDVVGGSVSGVLGTPRFMAPEIVRGEASPSADTDRFSLAVLLFYLLMSGHPLDGEREARIRCLDLPALTKLYGSEPLYIFDPKDHSNRPVPGIHDNPMIFQNIYPKNLMDLFEASFTRGLHYPLDRVREGIWRREFVRLRDLLVNCGSCGSENFYSPERTQQGAATPCWRCSHNVMPPPRMRLRAGTNEPSLVVLGLKTKLYPHHVGQQHDFSQPIAEVITHPTEPGRWGLRNLSTEKWSVQRPDGSNVEVLPGRSAPIVSGNIVHFGTASGEIRQ